MLYCGYFSDFFGKGGKSIFSEIFDLSPECPEAGTFPISLKESHKSAHRLQQGRLLLVSTLGNEIFERNRV